MDGNENYKPLPSQNLTAFPQPMTERISKKREMKNNEQLQTVALSSENLEKQYNEVMPHVFSQDNVAKIIGVPLTVNEQTFVPTQTQQQMALLSQNSEKRCNEATLHGFSENSEVMLINTPANSIGVPKTVTGQQNSTTQMQQQTNPDEQLQMDAATQMLRLSSNPGTSNQSVEDAEMDVWNTVPSKKRKNNTVPGLSKQQIPARQDDNYYTILPDFQVLSNDSEKK